jgi:hypothetical protein
VSEKRNLDGRYADVEQAGPMAMDLFGGRA